MARITATLTIRRYTTRTDRYHNEVEAPVDQWPTEDWPVWGIAPGTPDEPFEANRAPNAEKLTVYAPLAGPRPTAQDKVTVRGHLFDVDGEPAEWDENPVVAVTRHRGIVVNLERKTG